MHTVRILAITSTPVRLVLLVCILKIAPEKIAGILQYAYYSMDTLLVLQ